MQKPVVIQNFIDEEDAIKLINEMRNPSEINPYPEYYKKRFGGTSLPYNNIAISILKKYALKSNLVHQKLHPYEKNKIKTFKGFGSWWSAGSYGSLHIDDQNPEPFISYSTVIYLNEDFNGGVLNFVKNDISIKPKTGLLAAFAGGFENMHEVTLITKGVRYTLGSFWDDREESDYPEELRKKWEEEIKKVREYQEKEKAEWQEMIKDGYKLDKDGNKYKIEELDK